MEKLIGLPENPEIAFLRGNWHYHREKYEKALEFFEWALALNPGFQKAWNNKGAAIFNLGRYEEAIACYDKAIEIKEDYEGAWNSKGAALANLGRYEEAIACFDEAIEINPNYLSALMNLSEVLLILGDLTEGLKTAKKAFNFAEKVREKAICQFLCISDYLFRNEDEKAQKEMRKLITSSKELESPIVSGWDFSPLLPTMDERLEGKRKEILLSLISFLKGEIEVSKVILD